jgi:hypothetical protein
LSAASTDGSSISEAVPSENDGKLKVIVLTEKEVLINWTFTLMGSNMAL